jgi:hypothetical protein
MQRESNMRLGAKLVVTSGHYSCIANSALNVMQSATKDATAALEGKELAEYSHGQKSCPS